ncbi:MAG TPA: PTS sugar transporter subunit IIA [Chthoniobacterales bacterium]|nr:PTS sugar transporter subunit IIA [Chthoniobacterales bacterium]
MAVVLAALLDERRVVLELQARTGEAALREIVGTMADSPELKDAEAFLQEVFAREEKHSTYLGHGVALPHARTDLVTGVLLGIGRSRAGIPFGENGEPAHLIFLVGVPQRLLTDYLVCVGAVARLTSEEATRAALMNAKTAPELVEILREGSLLLE